MDTKNLKKEYKLDDLTVLWQNGLCHHSAVCVKNLNEVFNPQKRPWIDLSGADKSEIRRVVKMCPSGALSLVEPELPNDVVATNCQAKFLENGPIIITGDFSLEIDGEIKTYTAGKASLCRCGGSSKKPFCDGAHRSNGFLSKMD